MLRGAVTTLKNAIVLHLEPIRGHVSDLGFDLFRQRNVSPRSLFLQWNVIPGVDLLGEGTNERCVAALCSDSVSRSP
jgi:hypothetical protein